MRGRPRLGGLWRRIPAAVLTTAVLVLAGCGGERELTAASFVEEMNSAGAALELGSVLTTNPEGVEVHTVTISDPAPSATGEGRLPADASGSATLIVLDDAEGAREEFDRCEQAPSLTCYRAANAVLRAEDLASTDQARITTAIEALATSGD